MKRSQILAERTLNGSAAFLSGSSSIYLAKKAKENFRNGNKFCGVVDAVGASATGIVAIVNTIAAFEKK